MPGLVNRRKDEEALFRKVDNPGTPLEDTKSLQDSVTWLELFRQEEDTLVVARNGGQVVEITRLANKHKDDLIAVLQQYKNANNVFVAHADKNLPEGEVVIMTGHELPPKKVINPPTLDLPLLIFGMEDREGGGNDIRELQERLKELGYYDGDIDGKFGRGTDSAVKNFQAKFFGRAEADGKVGPLTWEKLWGEPVAVPDRDLPTSTKPYLSLTRTNQKDQFGCYVLALDYIKNDKIEGSINVCSGARDKQNFRKGADSVSGSREPLPEGRWFIHDIGWAGGKDNYHGAVYQTSGVGPVWIALDYREPGTTRRSAIGFHIDWNRHKGAPGTVGCVSPYNIADMKTLVSWLRDTDPRGLYVDWGLGTCPSPE